MLQVLRDAFFVLRELWLFLFLNLLGLFAFLGMPQGADILLSLMDNPGIWQNILLWCSIFFWSVSAHFCARFLIYMSDNSGHMLSPERVLSRKNIQKNIASFFLYFPVILIGMGLSKAFLLNHSDIPSLQQSYPLWLLALILLLILLYHRKRLLPAWMQLTEVEIRWTSKLYGIFNDYRIDLDKAAYPEADLPRNTKLINGSVIPQGFIFKSGPLPIGPDTDLVLRMYQIPPGFYKNLILQFNILAGVSSFLILVFAFLPLSAFHFFGTTTLICISFASWQVVYTLLHFADKTQPLSFFRIPYRFIPVLWICICSYINNDHPVRTLPLYDDSKTLGIREHFDAWCRNLMQHSDSSDRKKIPVFFIAAEGGALRTGAFTALLLAKMQDSFPEFKDHIYCYSSVSGAALGTAFFNSLPLTKSRWNQNNSRPTRAFFEQDFLAPVAGKLLFGEILNYFIPTRMNHFDRAIALEQSWEMGWDAACHPTSTHQDLQSPFNEKAGPTGNQLYNPFKENFNWCIGLKQSALFINTVEAETGMPCIYSNVLLDSNIALGERRDLRKRHSLSMAYSTAINLSTRFPIISPAAMISSGKTMENRFHYLDGGYYENKGLETLLEVLEALHPEKIPGIIPYVIQFNFSEDDVNANNSLRFANDLTEILFGIRNTRNARTEMAGCRLLEYMKSFHHSDQLISFNLDLSEKQLPMNWQLSKTAIQRIDNYTDSIMHMQRDSISIFKIFQALETK